jgi:hypothetical protein
MPDQIENKNVSKRTPQELSHYYANEDDLRFVYEKYPLDFDLFGYSLDEAVARFRNGS